MRKSRVLVVEDDRLLWALVSDVLSDEGFDVRTAANGQEALDVLESWIPDVILLDLMMPVMNGPAFRSVQKNHPTIAEIPVIVMSAAANLEAETNDLDPAGVLGKPFDLDDLISTVRHTIVEKVCRP